jgi:hypothetical protein
MMETDWKKALDRVSIDFDRIARGYAHVAAQQLDLHRHNGLANPHQGEDPREDEVLLLASCAPRKEQTQQQAEDERTPEVPVFQAFAHATLQNHVCIRPSPSQAPQVAAKAV